MKNKISPVRLRDIKSSVNRRKFIINEIDLYDITEVVELTLIDRLIFRVLWR